MKNTGKIQAQAAVQGSTQAVPYYAKRRRRWVRWLVWPVLLLPLIYIGIQVFIITMPNVRTQVAIMEEMTETIDAQGLVVFSSAQVHLDAGGGTLYYTVANGQRVPQGGQVAAVFANEAGAQAQHRIDRINTELEQLEASQKNQAEAGDMELLLSQRQAGVYALLDSLQSHSFVGVQTPKAEITTAANKLQIVAGEAVNFEQRATALTAQKEALAAQAVPVNAVASPATGYFIPSDSYDRTMTSYETATAADAQALEEMLQAPAEYYGADVVGHVVDDYKWHFFTVIDNKQAEKFAEGKKLEIVFPDVSDEKLPVMVQSLQPHEESGKVKLELFCDHVNPMVLQLRNEKAQIVMRTQTGVRIDKRALRFNEEGDRGVYVLMPGNVASFRRIDVLLEDAHYFLVPRETEDGVNEVMLYDEVIVDAGGAQIDDGRIV